MKALLIHGYGEGISIKGLKRIQAQIDLGGFSGFAEYIKTGEAQTFMWAESTNLHLPQFLNPFEHYNVLKKDKARASSDEVQNLLANKIIQEDPEIIIAHSLGGVLLFNTIVSQRLQLNKKVRIVLLSSYLAANYDFSEFPYISNVENYYCYWDQALLAVGVREGFKPAGLVGFANKKIKNRFYPLKDNINLHTSMLVNKGFAKAIIEKEKIIQ
jgi:hypothetical protein